MAQIRCKNCDSTNYVTSKSGVHIKASCADCGSYIKFLPQEGKIVLMPFGKYKDTAISQIYDKNYIAWLLKESKVKGGLKGVLEERLKQIS